MPARRAKPRQIPAPKTFYIDNRAASLLAEDSVAVGGTSDDDLLETREVADWIKVSYQRLTIGRIRNYGPKFIKVSPHRVAYRRGDIRAWLKSRTFSSTAEARNA
jgi:predicted DNA-binding transcriptional regulator AlpA